MLLHSEEIFSLPSYYASCYACVIKSASCIMISLRLERGGKRMANEWVTSARDNNEQSGEGKGETFDFWGSPVEGLPPWAINSSANGPGPTLHGRG